MQRYPGHLAAALAAASLGIPAAAGSVGKSRAAERAAKKERPATVYVPQGRNVGSIAQGNRWTGKPHEHRREIARGARLSSPIASK